MAIDYARQLCESCGGQLRYHSDISQYECSYCGNTYEKTESYDGAFSIRYAAEETLKALISNDRSLITQNLNECRKIDPSYAGTTVAELAVAIFEAVNAANNSQEKNRALQKASVEYGKLGVFSADEADEEADFYAKLESADSREYLMRIFRTFNDEARMSYIGEHFSAENISSQEAAAHLLARAFDENNFGQVDDVLASPAPVDVPTVFSRLLMEYPSGEKKLNHVSQLLGRGIATQHIRDSVSSYLSSVDSAAGDVNEVLEIVTRCSAYGGIVKGEALASIMRHDSYRSHIPTLIEKVCSSNAGRFLDEDIDTVLSAGFSLLSYADIEKMLSVFASNDYFIDFSQQTIMGVLEREDFSADVKKQVCELAGQYGLKESRRQGVLSVFLEKYHRDDKAQVLQKYTELMSTMNPHTVEQYLMGHVDSPEVKEAVVAVLISRISNPQILARAFANYQNVRPDSEPYGSRIAALLSQSIGHEGRI